MLSRAGRFYIYKMLRQYLVVFTLNILCVYCELINKHEGSRCTWKEASGLCVNIFRCESAQMFLETREHPPICTFQGKEPVVCCTDCTLVEDVRKLVFNSEAGLLTLTGQIANDKCVNFIDKLDYDCKKGAKATYDRTWDPDSNCYSVDVSIEQPYIPEELPKRISYLALLGYGDDIKMVQWLCAGAVISEKFILTAAHCLSQENLGPVRYVALGILNRTDSPKLWQTYNVKRVIAHPEYQPLSKYNDIALLETEKTITFSNEVLPACLHSDANVTEPEANIIVWDSDGEDQGTLKQVPLEQFDEIQCSILYPPHDKLVNGFNETTQICYGDDERPEDSCQSDSGSPLIASQPFNCAQYILGVSSSDRTCGAAGSSGMFTKVIQYVPWIESIVWP